MTEEIIKVVEAQTDLAVLAPFITLSDYAFRADKEIEETQTAFDKLKEHKEKWVSAIEVARICSLPVGTVRAWLSRKKIKETDSRSIKPPKGSRGGRPIVQYRSSILYSVKLHAIQRKFTEYGKLFLQLFKCIADDLGIKKYFMDLTPDENRLVRATLLKIAAQATGADLNKSVNENIRDFTDPKSVFIIENARRVVKRYQARIDFLLDPCTVEAYIKIARQSQDNDQNIRNEARYVTYRLHKLGYVESGKMEAPYTEPDCMACVWPKELLDAVYEGDIYGVDVARWKRLGCRLPWYSPEIR